MSISRIAGQMLQATLQRDGVNLAFQDTANSTPVLSLDIANSRIGINVASPGVTLDVTGGNIDAGNISLSGNVDSSNITVSGQANIANSSGILMSTPAEGNLVSNAVVLTTTTPVNSGIALLNRVLGKLVPPAPPNFPGTQTLSISGLSNYRMANIVQIENSANIHAVSAGTTVTTTLRVATYATNTISTVGPGDSGTVTAYRNGTAVGNVTLTGTSNGTYGANLVISANQDYNLSNANIVAGFWTVFSAAISGSNAPAGWNDIVIVDSAAGTTNVPSWYYDNSAPGTPGFSSVTFTAPVSPTVTYSSTVPHYTNTNQFTAAFTANRLSGNMYPTSDTFVTGTAGGAFAAPASVTYQASSLASNVLPANASANVSTTSNIISGFGASTTGPSVSINNSYNTGTQAFTTALAANVLYKTGNVSSLTFLAEGNIFVGSSIGSGTGAAFRIVNPGSTDTPTFTANATAFDSTNGPLQASDATVVANSLRNDSTNYSTGYLPVGPDISSGRAASQYFTFKFVRTSTSKFDVQITGTIAGLWVALPGSAIDSTSSLNGWIDAAQIYGGSGIPGSNTGAGGNGSDGCSLGGVVPIGTAMTLERTTITFGTVSSSSTATNEIYVRIKLTAGQRVTSLSLQTASN